MRRPTSVPLDRVKFPLTLADGLRTTFADVVAIPLPAQLAALTHRLDTLGEEPGHGASAIDTRAVLIVEDDAELRSLTAALLEDEQLDTIECESAEAALAVMLIGGQHVALIFADIRLRGVMDGSIWRTK